MKKRCTACRKSKTLDEFAKDKRLKSGRGSKCKRCVYEKTRAWVEANRERYNEYLKNYNNQPERYVQRRSYGMQRLYGISVEGYDKLLAKQKGGCALCGEPPTKPYALHVDHDHDTGVVRGLLCRECNTGLGKLHDSVSVLRKAIAYLKRSGRGI